MASKTNQTPTQDRQRKVAMNDLEPMRDQTGGPRYTYDRLDNLVSQTRPSTQVCSDPGFGIVQSG